MSDCRAVANVAGVQWPCELDAPHPGYAHVNEEGQVIWCSHYEAIRNAPPKEIINPMKVGIQ